VVLEHAAAREGLAHELLHGGDLLRRRVQIHLSQRVTGARAPN
jgi:hypothetical protein